MEFNQKQRFSLRKYSIGVASVLLGAAFVASQGVVAAQADEVSSSDLQTLDQARDAGQSNNQSTTYRGAAPVVSAPTVSSTNATDPMPEGELTDLTQMARVNESDYTVSENTMEGNRVDAAQLPTEFQQMAPTDDSKRVAMIVAVSGRDGQTDDRYYSLISSVDSADYEVKEYNKNQRLIQSVNLGQSGQKVFYPTGSRSADRPKLTVVADEQGARLVFDRARNWKTSNKYAIRTVYSTLVAPLIPSQYGGSENSQTNFDQFTQQLPFASEVKVNYILKDTGEQIADSNIISAFANDSYKTVAAKESDFYQDFQNKGYTLVEEPTYKDGKINSTYWGGKGFVAINDVTNTVAGVTRELRVRRTVINDQGDITIEAWDKASGVKLPIQRYTKANGEVVNLSGFNTYVSEAIRPNDLSLNSNALYKEVAFAFKDEKGVMFYSNDSQTRYSETDVAKNPKLAGGTRLSSWTSSWRPAAAEINYVYAKTKANVDVEYINTNGETIKARQSVAKLADIGSSYSANTAQLKPERIVTADQKVYKLVAKAGVTSNGIAYAANGVATGPAHAAISGRVTENDQVVTFVYELDEQKAIIKYVNQTTGLELARDEKIGNAGDTINYSTAERIQAYEKAGYKLISDGFGTASTKVYDSDSAIDQEFVVVLEERIETVTPKDPTPIPDEPVKPNDPANWPKTVKDLEELTRKAVQIINFRTEEDDEIVFKPIQRTIEFEKIAHVNLVTGKITYTDWAITNIHDEDVIEAPVAEPRTTAFRSVSPSMMRTTGTKKQATTVARKQVNRLRRSR